MDLNISRKTIKFLEENRRKARQRVLKLDGSRRLDTDVRVRVGVQSSWLVLGTEILSFSRAVKTQ